MPPRPINLREKLSRFNDHWSPKIIARLNDYEFRLVKIKGEFVWHKHEETDEVFIVIDGRMTIAFRDGSVDLAKGEMYVVPRGIEHKPMADAECCVMVVEPSDTVNTGNAGGEMTAEKDVWI